MYGFSSCHPAVSMLYFISVLLITMFTANPLLIALALLGGIVFIAMLQPIRKVASELALALPLFAAVCVINPLISHNGATPLFFLNGNPVTLEAILYGVYIAAMLAAVIYWFQCFHLIMTSDRLLFLIGTAAPKIALLLCSAMRFIPLFKGQAKKIRMAQKAMGFHTSDSYIHRLKNTAREYSALLTWSLENAVDTGASMKARGYGLKGRGRFSLFRFTATDGVLLAVILVLDGLVLSGMLAGKLDFIFYPQLSALQLSPRILPIYLAFGLLSFLPAILEIKEKLQWKYYRSRI